MPDNPTFTYYAKDDRYEDGTQRLGITVMAVDNLPCEFPRESSFEFSTILKDFINDICLEDFSQSTDSLKLPFPLKKALILHKGKLTDEYLYMNKFID
jgi:alpha-aminoadipic semialdehyde synthase